MGMLRYPSMTIEITAADVTSAEEFLAAIVSDRVPEGRFTDGTALRDLTIKALAVISASWRKDTNVTRSLQSLLRVRDLAASGNDPAVDDAADAILSNWFLSRAPGMFSRGTIYVYVSKKQDYPIPRFSQFFYDRNLAFYLDSDVDALIPASSVAPIVGSNGNIVGYSFPLNVVAGKTGAAYNVFPAQWAGTGGFSPFVTRVVSSSRFEGGQARQTTVDYIDQAQNATAVRNLINERSILATLSQRYPAAQRVIALGMGDPEMQRDRAVELATGINLHVGGHFDVYADLPVAPASFEGTLGGVFMRPDGVINVFDDPAVPDWTATALEVGDVIRVTAGMADVPRDYPIREIRESELYVSERHSFSEAKTSVSYYMYRPLYGADVQIYPPLGVNTTGFTAPTVQSANRLVLPPMPHYDILDVMVLNPDAGDPTINDPDGYVHFLTRINETPTISGTSPGSYPFRIIGRSPENAQSARAFDELELPSQYNGKRVRVNYQTLAGFSPIDAFIRDRFQRVLCANSQLKARHPIYVSCRIPYALSPLATGTVDELKLRQGVVDLIMSFNSKDVLDFSDITTYVKNFSPNIGTVYAFVIEYDLLGPDGNVYSFETEDVVAMDPARLVVPNSTTQLEFTSMGVTDRTVRYLTRLGRIGVERR